MSVVEPVVPAGRGWTLRRRDQWALVAVAVGLIGAATIIVLDPAGTPSDVRSAAALDVASPRSPVTGGIPGAGALGQAVPPRAGSYREQVKTSLSGEQIGGRTTSEREERFTIEELGPQPDGATRLARRADGSHTEAVWRSDAVLVVSVRTLTNEECVFPEPVIQYRLPLVVGSTWEAGATCTAAGGSTIDYRATATVTSTQRLRVRGVGVDVAVIERSSTIDQRGQSNGLATAAAMRFKELEYFSPTHGLPVATTSSMTATFTGRGMEQTAESTRESRLLTLTPEAP